MYSNNTYPLNVFNQFKKLQSSKFTSYDGIKIEKIIYDPGMETHLTISTNVPAENKGIEIVYKNMKSFNYLRTVVMSGDYKWVRLIW